MRKLLILITFSFLGTMLTGQDISEDLVGRVTFKSSENVYVRFRSTQGLAPGDTLFIRSAEKYIPVLRITNLSSVSCVCTPISDTDLPLDHIIIGKPLLKSDISDESKQAAIEKKVPSEQVDLPDSAKQITEKKILKQVIRGSFSVNSYTDLSTGNLSDNQRFRYTFSFDARNISGSKISVQTHVSFRHKAGEWEAVKSDIFSALKMYSLNARYDHSSSLHFTIGRFINPRISGIGAIDGLQAEAEAGKFTFGAVTGFRPDYEDYGFNSKLFQAGGYIAFNTTGQSGYTNSALAFFQQMNGSRTDRRFLYVQHSNTLIKNLFFLGTGELDLYTLKDDKPSGSLSLTSLYLSLRWKMFKSLSLSGSYDARKNVVYYESYKSFTDRLLETGIRQGYRLQANYRINDNLLLGMSSGYRYLKTDPRRAGNINGYFTVGRIPGINLSATISGTILQTSYMRGGIAGGNISREFFGGKLHTGAGYKYIDFTLPESSSSSRQHLAEVNFSLQVIRNLSISAFYEGIFDEKIRYDRLYAQVRIRF